MKKTRLGIYSLAAGVFALAITGCGGNKQESTENTAAPAASRPPGKRSIRRQPAKSRESVKLDGAAPKAEEHQHGGRAGLLQGAHQPGR